MVFEDAKVNRFPNLPFRISTYNSGCFHGRHLAFSTGFGTPLESFVPYLKIATNLELAKYWRHWIDYYTGLLAMDKPLDKVLEEMSDKIVRVASGEKARHERAKFRDNQF